MSPNLGDYCSVIMGQAPPGDTYSATEGIPLIAGAGDFSRGQLRPKKFTSKPSKLSKAGDIVLSIRASIGDKVWADGEYCLGRGVAALRPGAELDANFLWHWLNHAEPSLQAKAKGATFLQVNRSDIAELRIAPPPLDEQRRIAAILDKADELRTKRREALTHLDTLTQSIFHSMFGAPARTSAEVRLDHLCQVSSGITKGRRTSATELTTFPYVAVSNVQDRALDMSVVKEIAVTRTEAERYRLMRGDLLLTEGGDPDKLGRGTIWNDELPWCLHQNHVFRVRPSEDVVPLYLNWYLASREARSYFLRMAKQTTGIASINKTQLSATPVKLPPLELQQTFATRVAAVERLKETHRKHLAELDALFASLQHRAFKGEL